MSEPGGDNIGTAETGEPDRVEGAVANRDVTWDMLSQKINDLVVMADITGKIFYVSPACQRLGYAQHEVIGRTAADFAHPDDLAHSQANVAALFGAPLPEGPVDREHRFRRADGSWVWLEGNPSLIHGPDGQTIGFINVFRDVSEKHAAHEALSEQTRRALMAEAIAGVGYWRLDAVTREVSWSEQLFRMFGQDPGGKPDLAASGTKIHAEDKAASKARLEEALRSGACWSDTVTRIVWPDGEIRYLNTRGACEMGADGSVAAVFGTMIDVTEQQVLKIQLREALDEAERATRVKSEFLANMSHEIRTPLTAVLGYAELLGGRDDLDPTARGHVERVAAAGRGLLAIVNDVLDFSKLEAGQTVITPAPTAVADVAREALEMFVFRAKEKALALRFEAEPGIPPYLALDADRLRQILVNLVGNAVKFTERGSVTVSLSFDEAAERLAVDVRDTGPGIPEAAQAQLFKRFSQIDGASTRAKGGTGLGLAICQGLAEATGGAISLTSRARRGSTFRLELPAPVAAAPAYSEPAPEDFAYLDGLRVLVVDDNAVNRELARAMLEPFGVEISEAADGQDGVALAQRLPLDLILMDLRMPRMDGRTAAMAIRAGGGPNRDIPILSFSAESEAQEFGAALGAPFTGRVSKPLAPAALLGALQKAIADEPAPFGEVLRNIAV